MKHKSVMQFQPKGTQKKVAPNIAHKQITATQTFQPSQDKPAGNRKSAFVGRKSGSSSDQLKQKSQKAAMPGNGKANAVNHVKLMDKHGVMPKYTKETLNVAGPTAQDHAKFQFYRNHPSQQNMGSAKRKFGK